MSSETRIEDLTLQEWKDMVAQKGRRNLTTLRYLEHLIFDHSSLFSASLQLLQVLICSLIYPRMFHNHELLDLSGNATSRLDTARLYAAISVCGIAQIIQLVIFLASTHTLMQRLQTHILTPMQLINCYSSSVIAFIGFYFLCMALSSESFFWEGPFGSQVKKRESFHVDGRHSPFSVVLSLLYFSLTTMTSTGFGDITPQAWYTELVANLEMLLNVIYNIGIFAFAVHHFHVHMDFHSVLEAQTEFKRQQDSAVIVEAPTSSRCPACVNCFNRVGRALLRFFAKYILLVMMFLQACNILILLRLDQNVMRKLDTTPARRTLVICLVFQVLQFALVFIVSRKLIQQIKNDHTLKPSFLAQGYLATALLFGGLYFMVFIMDKHTFQMIYDLGHDDLTVHNVLWKCVYFSLTTMTFTGYGDIYPTRGLSRAVVAVQLLVSVAFAVIILGLGTSLFIEKMHMDFSDTSSSRDNSKETSLLSSYSAFTSPTARSARTRNKKRSNSDSDNQHSRTILASINRQYQRSQSSEATGARIRGKQTLPQYDPTFHSDSENDLTTTVPSTPTTPLLAQQRRNSLLYARRMLGGPIKLKDYGGKDDIL